MAPPSLQLLDLPTPLVSDVLWHIYGGIELQHWLNLKTVCKAFAMEVDYLALTRDTLFNNPHRPPGLLVGGVRRMWDTLMPASQFASYLSRKMLLYPTTATSGFSQITFRVASVLIQRERERAYHLGPLIGCQTPTHQQFEEVIHVLCKAFVSAIFYALPGLSPEKKLRERFLRDPFDFDTVATSTFDYIVATGAACLGLDPYLTGQTSFDTYSDGFDPGVAHIYGDILSAACRGGDTGLIRKLLATGHVPQYVLLIEAAYEGHLEVIQLLTCGQSNSAILETYSLARVEEMVFAAVGGGHRDVVQFLLPMIEQPSLQFRSDFVSSAARANQTQFISQAIAMGWEMDEQDRLCMTPLDNACRRGHSEAVAVLLGQNLKPASARKPMYMATQGGHLGCLRELLNAGWGTSNAQSRCLFEACSRGRVSIVQFLLDSEYGFKGANTKYMHAATCEAASCGFTTILKILIKEGAKLNWARAGIRRGIRLGYSMDHVITTVKELEG